MARQDATPHADAAGARPRRGPGLRRAHRDQPRDGALLPRVLDVGHRQPRAARRARRAEAGAPPDPLLDVRPGPAARPARTPSARRSSARSWARYHPHGDTAIYDALVRMAQDFSHAPPAGRRATATSAGSARRGRRGDALHRVPAGAARPGAARRASTRRPSTSSRTTTTPTQQPDVLPRAVPQPARQRLPGHRGGHGDQHPAAQPRRGHRRDPAPDRQPRRRPSTT